MNRSNFKSLLKGRKMYGKKKKPIRKGKKRK